MSKPKFKVGDYISSKKDPSIIGRITKIDDDGFWGRAWFHDSDHSVLVRLECFDRVDRTTDCVLVSYDCLNGDQITVVVGRQRENRSVEIINAFQGDEAKELYEKLITKKEE